MLALRKTAKQFFMSLPYSHSLHFLVALPTIRQELRKHPDAKRFARREEMYGWLGTRYAQKAALYLEFGVWQGASIKEWARILTNPESRLVGFDSFEGLPADWDHAFDKTERGTFSTSGAIPQIDDSRVEFIRGWFNDTLPPFADSLSLGSKDLIIHLDADLYSSTSLVLHTLGRFMKPGTLLIFDEYANPFHEYRAFHDWADTYGRAYSIDAYSGDNVQQVAITLR